MVIHDGGDGGGNGLPSNAFPEHGSGIIERVLRRILLYPKVAPFTRIITTYIK